MAKISPSSIKYSIVADFVAEGLCEKSDVIGALFGQTEGLLGPDMELRELQKEGKIGRIEVDLKTENGRTRGEITVLTALDKTETAIIAAALETIDKIGPTNARISIKEIEDVRSSKRDYIMERAKTLLSKFKNEGMDMVEMENKLREAVRISKITTYGNEGLPAGPEVDSLPEVIVVEGRADVINLLRHGIRNVIGMQGAKLPKTIRELGEKKKLTLFVDGDRGGRLIAKNVSENADVDYIAVAPDGKEVEELTGKEILQSLRKKIRPEEFFKKKGTDKGLRREDMYKLQDFVEDMKEREVAFFDRDLNFIGSIPLSKIYSLKKIQAFIALTKHMTNRVAKKLDELNIRIIAAKTFGRIEKIKANLVSL